MDSFIALIGSIVIGSLLLLRVSMFQTDFKQHMYRQTFDLIVQDRAMSLIEMIDADFKDVGFGTTPPAFAHADSDSVVYYVDLGEDGITDSVSYFVSGMVGGLGTPNPRDKILYRRVNNGQPLAVGLGVTDFKLKYFNDIGNETNVLADIKTIEVTLELESTAPIDGKYSSFFFREKITPASLVH